MDQRSPSGKLMISLNKVHMIMKSTSDAEKVSKESAVLMSKATELFIRALVQEAYQEKNTSKRLEYKHLANVVHSDEKYNFLKDILPKKITVLQFKQIMAQKQAAEKLSDVEGESGSSDDEVSSSDNDSDGDSLDS